MQNLINMQLNHIIELRYTKIYICDSMHYVSFLRFGIAVLEPSLTALMWLFSFEVLRNLDSVEQKSQFHEISGVRVVGQRALVE